jgi:hypothetical protein
MDDLYHEVANSTHSQQQGSRVELDGRAAGGCRDSTSRLGSYSVHRTGNCRMMHVLAPPPLPHLPGLPRCSQRRKAAADPPRSDPFPTAQWQPVPVREIVAEHLEERQIDFVENILGIMWYLMRIGEALYVG